MLLDHDWFFGLRQDLQQLFIAQKVKSREMFSFGFQVVLQTLLNYIQLLVLRFKIVFHFISINAFPQLRISKKEFIYGFDGSIDGLKFSVLQRHLLLYIITSKNGFEIFPTSLTLKPPL